MGWIIMTDGMKKLLLGLAAGAGIGLAAGYGVRVKIELPKRPSSVAENTEVVKPAAGNALSNAPANPKGGRLISFEGTVAELGVVDQGTTVAWAFPYKNVGDQLLKIGEVTSTCGCTTSEPTPREVRPGGTGLLKVSLMTGNFSGPINKKLIVRSNDPAMPTVELSMKASIRTLFRVEPKAVQFGEIERGRSVSRELMIKPVGKHAVEILKAGTTIPGLTVERLPMNPADNGAARIAFRLEPNRNYGPFNYAVRVELQRPVPASAGARPLELILHALGTVAGPLRVKPESLFLGQVKPGDVFLPQKLMLSSRTGAPVEVRSVDTGYEGLKAELKPVKPGLEYELGLKSVTAQPPGLFHRTVRVLTSASDVPIEISVVGVVLKPAMTTLQ
jgi:hypothetical protein